MKDFLRTGLISMTVFACFVALPVYADDTITTATRYTDGITGFGLVGQDFIAQSFTTVNAGTISAIVADLEIGSGAPSDGVLVSLYTDSGGVPSSDLGDSSSNTIASVTCAAPDSDTYTFSSPITVTAATVYWIKFSRVGSLNNSNFYAGCGSAGSTYSDGTQAYYDGSWHNQNNDEYTTFIVVTSGGGGSSATTTATSTTTSILRSETISSVTWAILFSMLIYFFVILFRGSRKR